jgi:hypothetical protein
MTKSLTPFDDALNMVILIQTARHGLVNFRMHLFFKMRQILAFLSTSEYAGPAKKQHHL